MRWHCRRGTRELDQLLECWLTQHAASAGEDRLAGFEALLACEDRELQRWILGYYDCERDDLRPLVDEIRARPGP